MALRISKIIPEFWSLAKAKRERRKRISLLLASGREGDKAIAKELKGCTKKKRCHKPACPVCARLRQNEQYVALCRCINSATGHSWLTIILTDERLPLGELTNLNYDALDRIKNSFRQQVRRLFTDRPFQAMGVLEIGYDVANDVWEPHLHLICLGRTREQLKPLKRYYHGKTDRGAAVRKTKNIKDKKGFAKVASYLAKFVTYYGPKGSRQRLPEEPHNELVRYLDEYAFETFIFKIGLGGRGMPKALSEFRESD